jgi:hypothetical protein
MSFAFNFGGSIGGEKAIEVEQRVLAPACEVKLKDQSSAAVSADDLDHIHLAPGLTLLKVSFRRHVRSMQLLTLIKDHRGSCSGFPPAALRQERSGALT